MSKPSSTNITDWAEHDSEDIPAKRVKMYAWDGTDWVRAGVGPSISNSATLSSVSDTASSTILLTSSTSRKGFRIYNDSTATLYVKYGSTASTTSYTIKLFPEGMLFEDGYNGRVDGIWSADASGAARITSL